MKTTSDHPNNLDTKPTTNKLFKQNTTTDCMHIGPAPEIQTTKIKVFTPTSQSVGPSLAYTLI